MRRGAVPVDDRLCQRRQRSRRPRHAIVHRLVVEREVGLPQLLLVGGGRVLQPRKSNIFIKRLENVRHVAPVLVDKRKRRLDAEEVQVFGVVASGETAHEHPHSAVRVRPTAQVHGPR